MGVVRFCGRFRVWILALFVVVAAAGGWYGLKWHRESVASERRGAALDARIKKLETDAKREIAIGTKSEAVFQFLKENGFSASFNTVLGQREIVGMAVDAGCPHIFGCGDEVTLRVEVKVDDGGVAIAPASVDGMYSDCM